MLSTVKTQLAMVVDSLCRTVRSAAKTSVEPLYGGIDVRRDLSVG